MNDFQKLAAGVLVHLSDSLKAPHAPGDHHEWIKLVGDVGELLDQAAEVEEDSDEGEALMVELLAIAEAIDPKLTIERITSGDENDSSDDSETDPGAGDPGGDGSTS